MPKAGMVHVISNRCAHKGCTTIPSYGLDDGSKKPEYCCCQHGKAGIVNVRDKRCTQQGCTTTPSYGVNGGSKKSEYCCRQHAKARMVNVNNNRCAHHKVAQAFVWHLFGVLRPARRRRECIPRAVEQQTVRHGGETRRAR